MPITVDIENAAGGRDIPDPAAMRAWVAAALRGRRCDAEMAIRIVGEDDSAEFNRRYRDKSGPTNVLSFPADLPESIGLPLLGDLLVCAPVVNREARQQGKPVAAHWAHIVVHGTLHLLGYDHMDERDACLMEALETEIVTGLGFAPPYEVVDNNAPTHEASGHD